MPSGEVLGVTRLPTDTFSRLTRPSIGERIEQNSSCHGVHAQGLTTTPHPTARITKFREATVLEGLQKNLRECVLFIVQSGTCRRRAWHLGRELTVVSELNTDTWNGNVILFVF
jgi:hypothetical protein